MKKYHSIFTKEIYVDSPKDARNAIMRFCDYCKKDSIEQYHCSGYHASICQKVKDQILQDWSKDNKSV